MWAEGKETSMSGAWKVYSEYEVLWKNQHWAWNKGM